jgi:hypothetical protein
MPGYVSVPEKTLEHWSVQYINNRFHTHAALWWPARGQDINVRWLPARPGKAVQLELKTTTVTGPRSHEVRVDLSQLEVNVQVLGLAAAVRDGRSRFGGGRGVAVVAERGFGDDPGL